MNITYSIVNISSSTGFISESGLSLFVVLISTYYSDEMLSTVVSAARGKRQVISSITLSYAVIWPSGKLKLIFKWLYNFLFSDPCNCTINPGNVFYLCSDVQSSPCSCENSTQCQVHASRMQYQLCMIIFEQRYLDKHSVIQHLHSMLSYNIDYYSLSASTALWLCMSIQN